MYRIKVDVSSLNDLNSSHLYEKNWKLSKRLARKNYNRYYEDGFYFYMEEKEVTLWNGKERIYFPFFNSKNIKELYSFMPNGIFNSLEQFTTLLAPFMMFNRFNFRTTFSLFLCGDFKNGKIVNLSASNYFTTSMINDGKIGDNKKMCYCLEEIDSIDKLNQVIDKMIKSSSELIDYYKNNYNKD